MSVFQAIQRLLFFKINREEMLQFSRAHFLAGLIGTWVVGMGRYWDDPGANILQHLGLGSVIYIFVLAFFIWLIVLPFKVNGWNYFIVLTFISLTSFPAIFYAIPVERFVSLAQANQLNVWFLAVVAAWRLALLFFFIARFTKLSKLNIASIALLPICLIITVLTTLNLHRVVFNIMGGIRTETAHDSAYLVLMILTAVSMILVLPLLIIYIDGIRKARKKSG